MLAVLSIAAHHNVTFLARYKQLGRLRLAPIKEPCHSIIEKGPESLSLNISGEHFIVLWRA